MSAKLVSVLLLVAVISTPASAQDARLDEGLLSLEMPTVTRGHVSEPCTLEIDNCIRLVEDAEAMASSRNLLMEDSFVCNGSSVVIRHVEVFADYELLTRSVSVTVDGKAAVLPDSLGRQLNAQGYSRDRVTMFCSEGVVTIKIFDISAGTDATRSVIGSYELGLADAVVKPSQMFD